MLPGLYVLKFIKIDEAELENQTAQLYQFHLNILPN